jgi:drug/metabolite transporter (DMT)-like permease
VPFVLIAAGEQRIASSLAAILIASMPLMVALLSVRLSPDDRPTGLRLVGLVIGFGGVVALLGVDVAGRPGELLGAVLVLVATLGYATAPFIINRRLADLDPLGPIAASLAWPRWGWCRRWSSRRPTGCRPPTRWGRWPCSASSAPRSGWCCSSG